jgi:hypothetical protein
MKKYFLSVLFVAFSFLATSCKNEIGAAPSQKNKSQQPVAIAPSIDGLPAQVNPGNYIAFDSVESLSSISDLIVIAQPLNNLSESKKISKKNSEKLKDKIELNTSLAYTDEDGKIIDYQTITPVKIKKILKGNTQDKVISVSQRGVVIVANSQPFVMTTEGFTPLEKGSKYILFLKAIDTSTFPNMAGIYSIISVNQGKFNLDKSDKQEESHETKDPQYKKLKEKIGNKYKQEFDSVQSSRCRFSIRVGAQCIVPLLSPFEA